jgi:hypothetical protein
MPRREFTSQKALQAHAEQTGNVCVLEGIAIRQRQLSPDQYEIVDVRTSRGVLRSALLIPKAVLKALCEAEAPFREARRRRPWNASSSKARMPSRSTGRGFG